VTQAVFFLYVAVASFIALSDWRRGMLLMILAGVLQDPVRKMMAGTPGWMVLAFLPIWFALCYNLFLSGRRPFANFVTRLPKLRPRLMLFLYSLALAFLVLIFKHGLSSLFVGAIGLITYVFPLIAMVAGFYFVRDKSDLTRFVTVYSIIVAPFLVGGLLQYLGWFPDWRIIGTDVLGMEWIRQWPGHIVRLNSGFSRSPDVMGWQAALLVMFSLLMALSSGSKVAKVLWVGIAFWGGIILLVSGRNKMIFMPLIFITVFVLSYLYKGRVAKIFSVGLAATALVVFFVLLNNQMKLDQEYLLYVGEGSATASERVTEQGIGGIFYTIKQSGVFGEGLGSASTGARFGGATGIKTWQEAGLPKIVVELGVLGLVAFFLLGISIFQVLFQSLNSISVASPIMPFLAGMLGILAANGASFIVSHQIFGDPFIVTLTGFFLGIALSFARWQKPRVKSG
jgi:hypothetical protein